ncbi:MAG: polyprenyl synthetase family protein [Planctomycetaceae bacterium]|nr:polyprenyl synthetase family protein [Planctomycetaceae bacterium]
MKQPATAHHLLSRIEDLIGPHLLRVEEQFDEELSHPEPFVKDLLSHISRFRGKRLRPILVLLTARAAGDIRPEHTILAAVTEMIHTATLVHDDILDEAEIRRHVATINNRWNNETSVLLGDYLFTHAFHLAASLDTTLACRLIGASTNRVCVGELMQIHERGNLALSEEQYLKIIDGKTAELCALCGELGAHYAGADEGLSQSLREYGRSLGIAFQIADDVLDVTGNEEETGKTLGSDFVKQKLTLPIIRLLESADETQREQIITWIEQGDQDSRRRLQEELRSSHSIEEAHQRAQEYAQQARLSLSGLMESPARRLLEDLTDFAVQRSF